ncbi:MAG: hypothetical protein ACLF0P_15015, partial [Thermoanaerobaculia bacterium]
AGVGEELASSRGPSGRRTAASAAGGGELRPYRVLGGLVVALALTVLLAAPAHACPVCYGEADNSVIDGAKLSVLFLGALVYVVIGGGVGVVFALRRRVRKNLDSRKGLHLVPPETT